MKQTKWIAPIKHASGVQLLSVVALLLLYLVSRLHNITILPFFTDEGYHTVSAEAALEGEIVGTGIAYLGRVWYNAFLGPYPPTADFTTRAGTVIAGMLGIAALYALARVFVSHRTGLMVMLLWITSPFLLFFERMALSDPLSTPFTVVTVWVAWRLMRTSKWRWSVILSGMLSWLILLKASALPWIALPFVALLFTLAPWRKRLALGALTYGVFFGGFFLPFLLALKLRGLNYQVYLGKIPYLVGGVDTSLPDRLWRNIRVAWDIDLVYISLPIILLALAGGVFWLWKRPRSALLILLVMGIAIAGPVGFGKNLTSRYILYQTPWVLLSLACGAGLLVRRNWQVGALVHVAVGAWLILFYGPFQVAIWNDPSTLPLLKADTQQYIAYEPSGYGAAEIGAMLSTTAEPLPVLGLIANCQALRMTAYPLAVHCPPIRSDGTSQDEIMALAEAQAADGPIYVVGEQLLYIDLAGLPQPNAEVITVQRPGGHSSVSLFRVEAGAQRP